MLALGMFVLCVRRCPTRRFNAMQSIDGRQIPVSVSGMPFSFRARGGKITTAGTLYPELTGGKLTMTAIRLMADQGRAWPLLDGTGTIYGMYVINNISETGSLFLLTARRAKLILR